MKHFILRLLLSGFFFAAFQASADVKLSNKQSENLGIESVELVAMQVPRSYPAAAQVIDAAPLIALLGELRAAESSATASRNELQRAEKLHADEGNVSLKIVEAARAQALTDAGHVDALHAQLLSSWGSAVASMSVSDRDRLVKEVLAQRVVLVRAESHGNIDAHVQIKQARVRLLTDDQYWSAQVLGAAAQTANQGLGHAYLLRVQDSALQSGQVLSASLQDSANALSGVKVPRSAIVRWQGNEWVFLAEESNAFSRHIIHPIEWLNDGCLVQKELQAGQRVVIAGALLLLATESNPAAQE